MLVTIKQFGQVMDHRSARAGRSHNSLGLTTLEDFNEAPRNLASFIAIPGVESRLRTTGLPLVELHFTPRSTQYLYSTDSYAAPELIYETGNK
jgi:hypothetical protein